MEQGRYPDPERAGRSLDAAAALLLIGIAAGAALGVIVFLSLVLAGIVAQGPGSILGPGSIGYVFFGTLVAALSGAVLATAAAIGSIVVLLIFDRWGERSTSVRSVLAGIGAAAGAATLLLLVLFEALPPRGNVLAVGVSVVAAGLLAGVAVYRVERRSAARGSALR